MSDHSVVDFETKEIGKRPNYPPEPVGVSIKMPGKKPEYLAWGHPEGNNCDVYTARRKLLDAWEHEPIFHNSGFDLDISECYFGLRPPKRFHDTLFLAFLENPYEDDMGLKPLAAHHLDEPPTERDELKDWVIANIAEAKKKPSKWHDHMWKAPVNLMGRYSNGDTRRTDKLYDKFYPSIVTRSMLPAYNRELGCVPITLEMERSGVRVHRKRIHKAIGVFTKLSDKLSKQIKREIGVPQEFNLNSPKLGDALLSAGKLKMVVRTKTGKVSTKADVLLECCSDRKLRDMLAVRGICNKYMSTFLKPWLEQAELTDGRILPNFNQVSGSGDYARGGAKSGRYSSSDPNLQQVATNVDDSANKETLQLLQKWLMDFYGYRFVGLRDFIIPDEGSVIIATDYSQQELRLLAHFEKDTLMKAYLANPLLDTHEYVSELVSGLMGVKYPRKSIKTIVFGIIYGMGIASLSRKLGTDRGTAKRIRDGVLKVLPGVKRLMDELRWMAKHDEPLVTWGGRQYYCEEPKKNKETEELMTFEYKMLNYKIQPSAADVTKQGMINVREACPKVRIAIQVHDELVCMAPNRKWGPRISEAMCDMKINVPLVAEPTYSEETWARAD